MKKQYFCFQIIRVIFLWCCFMSMGDALAGSVASSCLGDNDGDGIVSKTEVDSAINQFLGKEAVQESCDEYGDEAVNITDLQRIVDRHINGCNAGDWYEDDDTPETGNILMLKSSESLVPGYESFQSHNFHSADDVDWIKFYAQQVNKYKITVYGAGDDCDPVIELYDEKHIFIDRIDDGFKGDDEDITLTPTVDGVYYAKIYHSNESGYKSGNGNSYKVVLSISEGPALPGAVYGKVIPAVQGVVKTDFFGEALISSSGWYVMPHAAGSFNLWVEAAGYTYHKYIKIGEAQILRHDIRLQPAK